jgi:hypothetical protein
MTHRSVEPWDPAYATTALRAKVCNALDVWLTSHAKDQMRDRSLFMGDVLHILKNGFVYDEAEQSTRDGQYKYKMECNTPNSGARIVKIVVIPSSANAVKIVTVMWRDEN